jgi:hypothetical protein
LDPADKITPEDRKRVGTIILFIVLLIAAVVVATVLYAPGVDSGPPTPTPTATGTG